MKEKNKIDNNIKILNSLKKYLIKYKAYIIILIISIIISIPMFSPNFNMQYDDGVQHICRLIGTLDSIKEGQIFPMIMSKFCNNFGYSWNLFYSPTTAYIPLIFKIFNISFEMCLKIFMLFVSIFTGISMYFFMKKITKNDNISILAAILYILAPYRLNDMYIRLAISELTSFIFIPIVFNGLYTIINEKRKTFLLVIGSVGMILTHSLLTVYLVIFCLIYIIVNINKIDKKVILELLKSIILIILLTSFYTFPLIESKLSADYEVFNQEHMVRTNTLIDLKPNILELFFNQKGRMMYGIGIIVILGVIYSLFILKKIKDKKNFILFLILGIISLIMTLDIFPFEKLPSFFTMMQFSFRMLEFSSFFLVVVASIAFEKTLKKFNIYTVILLSSISILLLLPSLPNLNYGKYYNEEELEKGIKVTSSTGRVHAGCASFEYLPTKAFKNREYIENREDVPIVLNNENYKIDNYYKNGTNTSFYITEKGNASIELPYIYYIGYEVRYQDKIIDTYESENGFLCVNLEDANGTVEIKYTGTIIMKAAYIISITTLSIIIIYFIVKHKKVKDKDINKKDSKFKGKNKKTI